MQAAKALGMNAKRASGDSDSMKAGRTAIKPVRPHTEGIPFSIAEVA